MSISLYLYIYICLSIYKHLRIFLYSSIFISLYSYCFFRLRRAVRDFAFSRYRHRPFSPFSFLPLHILFLLPFFFHMEPAGNPFRLFAAFFCILSYWMSFCCSHFETLPFLIPFFSSVLHVRRLLLYVFVLFIVLRNLPWNFRVICVLCIFSLPLTTILLCKVSTSGVGKGALTVCLNIFFRLFGCCGSFSKTPSRGLKIYWTSLAVFHLLLVCFSYARKISINIKKIKLWTQWTISLFPVT